MESINVKEIIWSIMFNTILYNSVTEKYIYKQTIFKAKKSKKYIF